MLVARFRGCFLDNFLKIFSWYPFSINISLENTIFIKKKKTRNISTARTRITNVHVHWEHLSHDMTKPTKWVCAQQRLRSAWASAQSDQSLRWALNGYLRTQAFFMRTAKTLIRLGECPDWSESSLGAQPFCWFCHAADIRFAYMFICRLQICFLHTAHK